MQRLASSIYAVIFAAMAVSPAAAQDSAKYSTEALEQGIAEHAVSRLAVMVPMRDGVRLSTNIFTPRDARGPLPTILWKTPYNEHKLRGSTLRYASEAVKRRSEEHTSELKSLMRISYAVFCLNKTKQSTR